MKKYGSLMVLFFLLLSLEAIGAEKASDILQKGNRLLGESAYAEAGKAYDECIGMARACGDRPLEAEALLCRARYYLELLSYDRALDDARTAEKLSGENSPGAFAARLSIISTLYAKGRIIEAWKLMDELEKREKKGLSTECLIDFLLLRGEMLQKREKYELAGKNFQEGLTLAEQAGDRDRAILARCHQALLEGEKKDFVKASEICLSALEDARNRKRSYLVGLLLEADGTIKRKDSRSQEAITSFISALEVHEKTGNRGKTGKCLLKIAAVYLNAINWEKGLEYERKALKVYRDSKDAYGSLVTCNSMLEVMYSVEKQEGVDELLREFQELSAQVVDPSDRAWAMLKRGNHLAFLKRDYDGALASYRAAGDLYCSLGDRYGELRCLAAENTVFMRKSDYAGAIRVCREALKTGEGLEEINEHDDSSFFHQCSPGSFHRQMATGYTMQSFYKEALESCEKALEKDRDASHTFDRIMDRYGIIIICMQTYDLPRAEKEIHTAFEEIPTIGEIDLRAVSYNLIVLSLMISRSGKGLEVYGHTQRLRDSMGFRIMEKIYRDPVVMAQIKEGYTSWIDYEHGKKNYLSEGLAWTFLGFFYFAGGKNTEAEESYEKGLELLKKCKMPMMEGIGYIFLTQLLVEEGRLNEARSLMEEELQVYVRSGNVDFQLIALNSLAILLADMGKSEESLRRYEEALKLAEEKKELSWQYNLLTGMGLIYLLREDYARGLDCFQKATGSLKKLPNKAKEAVSLTFAGKCLAALGRKTEAQSCLREALPYFRESNSVFEERDASLELGRILEESGKEGEALEVYLSAIRDLCNVRETLSYMEKKGDAAGDAPTRSLFERTIQLLIRMRRYDDALKYFEMSGAYEMVNNLDLSAIQTKDEKLKELLDAMQALSQRMKLLRQDIAEGNDRKRVEYLTGVLASTRQEFFAVINEIRKRNPDFENLLAVQGAELAELQRIIPEGTILLEYYPSGEALFIFVVTREAFSIKKVGVSRERLYELVKALREQVIKPGQSAPAYARLRSQLYRLLLEPVREEIARKKEVQIIPAGLLWYIPFEALGEEGAPDLIEEKPVGYLYSSDILRLLVARRKAEKPLLVAFGNPSGVDLPLAKQEVESIGAIFPGSRIFTGDAATREKFIAEAPGASLLHVASHSILNREDINRSSIQFAGGSLSLGEIYGLQMPSASLVVLSSCDSAMGEDYPGREFASLASAFTIAGSSSVIASLWKVEDASTSLLFKSFYGSLARGMTKSGALRQAKRDLKKNPSTSSPFYWAGFILLGDWR